jgi:hypothetical protein
MDWTPYIIVWIVCGIASLLIAQGKGLNTTHWFVIGVLLGPLGVLAAVFATRPVPEGSVVLTRQTSPSWEPIAWIVTALAGVVILVLVLNT